MMAIRPFHKVCYLYKMSKGIRIKMKKRIEYFDIAKGFSMICIILGHLGIGRVNSFVFTFHVPIFFLISGYFLSDKLTVGEFMKKRAKQLILPYMLTCFFIIAGVTLRDILVTHGMGNVIEDIKTWLIATIYGSGSLEYSTPFYMKQIGALWFLLAMFFAMVIVRFFMQFQYGYIGILITAYVGYKTTDMVWLPFSVQAGMTAALFVYFGMLARKYQILEQEFHPAIKSGLAVIWLICTIYAGRLYMVRNYYENGLLDIVGALAGSYLVIMVARTVEKNTEGIAGILRYYGSNSLILLCFHVFELCVIDWGWVWRLFGDRLQVSYVSNIIILVLFKLVFCTAGIFVVHMVGNRCTIYFGKVLSGLQIITNKVKDKIQFRDRIVYWDVAKGFAILLMILGYTQVPDYLRLIIFSFHMPFFIIANGYFIKSYDIKRTFCRSVRTLLYPYIITCLLSAVIYAFMGNGGSFSLSCFLYKIKAMLGGMSKISVRFQDFESVWGVWFVCCLFITRNLYVIIMKKIENYTESIRIAIILLLAMLGQCIGKYYAFMPWSLDVALVSLVFIAFGDWMKKSNFMTKGYFCTFVLPMAVWIYFLLTGTNIELATRSYPLGILSVVEAIAGSIVLVAISQFLSKYMLVSAVMSWIGKNSMVILGIHCLELMYFDWNRWVYPYLPFSMNWFREFVIKCIVILVIAMLIGIVKNLMKTGRKKVLKHVN